MIKKAVIRGTGRSVSRSQDLFCNGLGVLERDRARSRESSATVIMKNIQTICIHLISICIFLHGMVTWYA